MALTRAQIIDLVKEVMNRTSGTDADSDMVTYLNMSQLEIARAHRWSCLETSTTGTFTDGTEQYSWPTNLRHLRDFRITGSNKGQLRKLERPRDGRWYPDATEIAEGIPVYYADEGTTYRLLPIPDDDYPYYMSWVKWPAEMTADGDTSDLLNMDDLLVYMTAMHASLYWGVLDDYGVFRTMVYTEYPLGSGNKRGLLAQCVQADKDRVPRRFVKQPALHDQRALPSRYWARPDVMET